MMDSSPKTIDIERRIINLMLMHSHVVKELQGHGITQEFFDADHRPLVQAIFYTCAKSDGSRKLTDEHYKQILLDQGSSGDITIATEIYSKCMFGMPLNHTVDDLDFLYKSLIEQYVFRQGTIALNRFNKNVPSKGYLESTKIYADDLISAINLLEVKESHFLFMDELKDKYVSNLKNRIVNPETRITCGIAEIDEALGLGFKPGHTSLFIAATGGHKSNMMMNIALGIHRKSKANILFVPLEMDWEDFTHRVISNKTKISYSKLLNPIDPKSKVPLLSADDFKKIEEASLWIKENHRFAILDVDEQIPISRLRTEIEKKIKTFAPQIVVVDYLGLVRPDTRHIGRHDLDLGDISKTLKFMGKKYGFHVITAAQLGRADIKRIREEGADAKLDSTAVKGSHEVSADVEHIFALTQVPDEPERLKLHVIKNRSGPAGYTKDLRLQADTCQIDSTEMAQGFDDYDDHFDDFHKQTDEQAAIKLEEKHSKEVQFDYSLEL